MLDVAATFRAAWQYHQAGDVARAEQLYRQVLEADPRHADAWHLLGAAHLMRGRAAEGEAALRRALELNPHHGAAHENLGIALAQQGKLADAVPHFREAVRLQPGHAQAHLNLGGALLRLDRLGEAADSFRAAVRLRPGDAEAHYKLGKVLAFLGRRAEAAARWERTVALDPRHAAALGALGEALVGLGRPSEAVARYRQALELRPDYFAVLMNLGCLLVDERPEEALALFRRADAARPGSPEAGANIGFALTNLGRAAEAEATFRAVLARHPDAPEAHSGLGVALARQDRHEEGLACQRRALELRPNYAEAHHNRGVSLVKLGRVEEAIAAYREALRCQPNLAEAHATLAVAYLALGRFPEGWAEYEWRWHCKIFAENVQTFREPAWDGSPLGGRTILVHTEQGLGDVMQFVRYLPLVKARGGTVLLQCPEVLHALLGRCRGIDRLLPQKAPLPPFDVQAPLLSLPRLFGTTVETIPADVPYLSVPDELVERWRRELEPIEGFKVGISWRGNPRNPYDRYRSFGLEELAPLARVPGVRLVSLQKGPGTEEEVRRCAGQVPVVELGSRLDREGGAFLDTGAVMKNLDLVISADTAPAHLAGGLGVPVWVLLPFAAEWRWLMGRDDSPWYPTARLFRQPRPGDWATVLARVAAALAEARHRPG